jgi:hypothetical protein
VDSTTRRGSHYRHICHRGNRMGRASSKVTLTRSACDGRSGSGTMAARSRNSRISSRWCRLTRLVAIPYSHGRRRSVPCPTAPASGTRRERLGQPTRGIPNTAECAPHADRRSSREPLRHPLSHAHPDNGFTRRSRPARRGTASDGCACRPIRNRTDSCGRWRAGGGRALPPSSAAAAGRGPRQRSG